MKIGITGASGMIGWHLRCHLFAEDHPNVSTAGRETFDEPDQLDAFVREVDVLVHLAGVNRGEPDEIESVNIKLAKKLIESLKRTGATPHLIFSSSTHRNRDTPYGRAKRQCADLFAEWAHQKSARYMTLILPHVFGEHGRPFYNSVVHTFCYQLANHKTPEVEQDSTLQLLHARHVARRIVEVGQQGECGDIVVSGEDLSVSKLLDMLKELAKTYGANIVPDIRSRLTLDLFNTYRSFLYPEHFPVSLERHRDDRGDLFELVKELNGGQVYVSTTKPGITRGEHFHTTKFERFVVLKGTARIGIRRMFSDEVKVFEVSGDRPQVLDIPTLHSHNLTNTGQDELMTLFWSHEIFNPEKPDTVRSKVQETL